MSFSFSSPEKSIFAFLFDRKNWGNIVYLFSLTYRCNIIAIVDLISAIAKFFPIQFLKHQFEMRFISEKGWCSEIRKLWFLHQKYDNTCVLLKSEELFLKLVSRLVSKLNDPNCYTIRLHDAVNGSSKITYPLDLVFYIFVLIGYKINKKLEV